MAKTMDRRSFLALAASSVAVGALMVLQGCSDSDSSPTTEPTATFTDKRGTVYTNHGHSVTLTAAQQQAGAAVTLTLSSGAGHTHTLGLRAAEVASVAAGTRVSLESSVDAGHSHTVAFN